MAHVKAGSSRAHQKANVVGKRRGLKVNQGQFVNGGQVLVRQTGMNFKAGMNTKVARDHSIISKLAGIVSFSYMRRPHGVRTVVNVSPKVEKTVAKKVSPKKTDVKKEAAKKVATNEVVKKATTKKTVKKDTKK